MFNKWLGYTLYIRIYRNRFVIRNVKEATVHTVTAKETFSSQRLLVANFTNAETTLRAAVKDMHKSLFSPSPLIVIQAMELNDGGLSQIEERAIRELAAAAGARQVFVWEGHELNDQEVMDIAGGHGLGR